MMEILGIIGGAIAAKVATSQVAKLTSSMNLPSFIPALVPVGIGVVLAGNKNKALQGVGYGMIAVGGSNLAAAFIPGITGMNAPEDVEALFLGANFIGEDEDGNPIFLSDPADQSILSDPADQSILSASPEELEEMVLNGAFDSEDGSEF